MKNLVEKIFRFADKTPSAIAIENLQSGESWTYEQLREKIQSSRQQLKDKKIYQKKILILERPTPNLIVKILALMAEGNCICSLDPSLEFAQARESLKDLPFDYYLTSWQGLFYSFFIDSLQKAARLQISNQVCRSTKQDSELYSWQDLDIAFLSLTSGTTGPTKIVPITFANLQSRQELAHRYLPPVSPDVHLAGYLLSHLQNLTEGATCIFTRYQSNWTELATSLDEKITRISGPPGDLIDFSIEAQKYNKQYPKVQNVILGGAPLSDIQLMGLQRTFPNSKITVIYGSTECEPISKNDYAPSSAFNISGYKVGAPVSELEIKIQPCSLDLRLPTRYKKISSEGQLGELWLCGPQVVAKYLNSDRDEKLNKVTANGKTWHRTGDLVYQNSKQEITLIGRTADLIPLADQYLPSLCLENHFEEQLGAHRVVAKKMNSQIYILIQMPDHLPFHREKAFQVLKDWGLESAILKQVDSFPVDRRHRWKIQRSKINL